MIYLRKVENIQKDEEKENKPKRIYKKPKKNGTIDKDDKPLIFVVSPEQMMIYQAYNKTMTKSKAERDNVTDKTPHTRDNNQSLPKDWNNDEYYF